MKVIFAGGPESGRFVNNYIAGLASHGIVVTRHWPDPGRKTHLPADVEAVIINGDASTPVQQRHVRDLCQRSGVPWVIGSNSVSHTVSRMTSIGFVAAPAEVKTLPPVDGFEDRMAPWRTWTEIESTEQQPEPKQAQPQEEVMTSIQEVKEIIVERDGSVRLRITVLDSADSLSTRSTTPVVWGGKFFASKTELAEAEGVAVGNLDTYIRSGNPFHGEVLTRADVTTVVKNCPGVEVTDRREDIVRVIEFDVDGRAFMRLDGGRRRKLTICPDGVIRSVTDAASHYGLGTGKVAHDVRDCREGFREPTVDEIKSLWPSAVIEHASPVPAMTAVFVESKRAEVAAVVPQDLRLADVVSTPPGTNFLALVLESGVVLVPVSAGARALVPESRHFDDLSLVSSLFPSGLLVVRP